MYWHNDVSRGNFCFRAVSMHRHNFNRLYPVSELAWLILLKRFTVLGCIFLCFVLEWSAACAPYLIPLSLPLVWDKPHIHPCTSLLPKASFCSILLPGCAFALRWQKSLWIFQGYFTVQLSRFFVSLLFSNFYILSFIKCFVNNFFYFFLTFEVFLHFSRSAWL